MTPALDLDSGRRRLAGHVLAAAGRGDQDAVADLIEPLGIDQLRSLVAVLAAQVDQTMTETSVSGPAAVCDMAIAAAAHTFGTTPEAIVSKERSRTVSDARADAMTVAREAGLSLPAISERFNKDHGSVIHAVRHTAERPRLADAAARISEHVQARFSATLPRPEQAPAPESDPTSTFAPSGVVEHAVAAAAAEFGTTPERLLGREKTRAVSDARAVAMTAARMHGESLPQIARHFDGRDHTTVLHATRRVEKTPPLRSLAAQIAAGLPERDGVKQPAANDQTREQVTALRSRGARAERQAVGPQQSGPAQLRVAR